MPIHQKKQLNTGQADFPGSFAKHYVTLLLSNLFFFSFFIFYFISFLVFWFVFVSEAGFLCQSISKQKTKPSCLLMVKFRSTSLLSHDNPRVLGLQVRCSVPSSFLLPFKLAHCLLHTVNTRKESIVAFFLFNSEQYGCIIYSTRTALNVLTVVMAPWL